MKRLLIKTLIFLLEGKLSVKDRNALMSFILKEQGALPLSDIIYISEEQELIVNGKPIDADTAIVLRESARSASENKALNLIRQQVTYLSFIMASVKAVTPEDLLFARSAVWYGQQVDKYLKTLAQTQEPTLS